MRALITGASRGLGLEIARHLGRAGAELHLLARDAGALALAAGELSALSSSPLVHTHVADVTDAEAAADAVREVAASGPIDVLVNNAAVLGPVGPLETLDFAAWRTALEVDLVAPARLCQLVIPGMRRAGRGKIINISGGGATSPRPFVSAYAVAKCGLVRLTETLSAELAGTGIDVNAVAPGPLATRMQEDLLGRGPEAAPAEHARAREVLSSGGTSLARAAELVAWLASSESDGITGRLLSAVWDDWPSLSGRREALRETDVFTLRRIVPADRGKDW